MATGAAGGGGMTSMCPQCGSGDAARLQAVYEQGTRDYVSDSPAFGVTVGGSSTVAAQRAAPPQQRYTGTATVLIVVGGVMLAFTGLLFVNTLGTLGQRRGHYDPPPQIASAVVGEVFLTAVFAGLVWWGLRLRAPAVAWNRDVWPGLYAEWQRQWTCRRCGNVWTP